MAGVLARGGFSYSGQFAATDSVLAYTRWRTQEKLAAPQENAWLMSRFRVEGSFTADFGGKQAVVVHTVHVGASATTTPFLTPEYQRAQ
jgi:hypothetical protein